MSLATPGLYHEPFLAQQTSVLNQKHFTLGSFIPPANIRPRAVSNRHESLALYEPSLLRVNSCFRRYAPQIRLGRRALDGLFASRAEQRRPNRLIPLFKSFSGYPSIVNTSLLTRYRERWVFDPDPSCNTLS